MPSRNTGVLKEILQTLEISEPHALARLEQHFKDSLLVVAGDINRVTAQAQELGLAINTTECGLVDHLAPQARITML